RQPTQAGSDHIVDLGRLAVGALPILFEHLHHFQVLFVFPEFHGLLEIGDRGSGLQPRSRGAGGPGPTSQSVTQQTRTAARPRLKRCFHGTALTEVFVFEGAGTLLSNSSGNCRDWLPPFQVPTKMALSSTSIRAGTTKVVTISIVPSNAS